MTEESSKVKINIESELKRFKDHLDQKENYNLFFSGIYGSGKSYFLNEFINRYKSEYNFFNLTPVKYSISSNEDIFKYIKYDIGFQLLSKDIDFDKIIGSLTDISLLYLKENPQQLIKELSRFGGTVGTVSKMIEVVYNLKEKITEHKSVTEIDDKGSIITFLNDIKDSEGSIYEENIITELISKYISDETNILIIDDFDRLDPGHVFRLLNVLSCHIGIEDSNSNKLGFNKVVLVGDINNIRNIYKHLYGNNVDFDGYIDKFYSTEVFYLNNLSTIISTLSDILKCILPNDKQDTSYPFYSITEFLLTELLLYTKFNLRSLLNLVNSDYNIEYKEVKYKRHTQYSTKNYVVYEVFIFLTRLIGDQNKLLKLFEDYVIQNPIEYVKQIDLDDYRHFLSFYNPGLGNGVETKYTHNQYSIEYNCNYFTGEYNIFYGDVISINNEELDEIDFPIEFPISQLIYDCYISFINIKRFQD